MLRAEQLGKEVQVKTREFTEDALLTERFMNISPATGLPFPPGNQVPLYRESRGENVQGETKKFGLKLGNSSVCQRQTGF